MKNQRRKFFKTALLAGMSTAGLTSVANARGGRGKRKETTILTDEQKESIFFMYQEEKVARDVYITLGDLYPNETTFASIQLSEQRHIDAVEGLCDKYAISKKGVNEGGIGNFVLDELKELYEYCIAQGEESLLAALQVGELIEITDIEDLEKASIGMPSDVVNVFSNLKEGSLNHLESFRAAIKRA